MRTSHCGGFSCCGARGLGARASVVVARGLSSCGTWAQLLRGMWDLPRLGLEPMCPALAGGFLTTVPPGKSAYISLSIVSLPINAFLMEMEFRIGLTPTDQVQDLLEKRSALHGEMSAGSSLWCSVLWFIKCFHTYCFILSSQQPWVTKRAESIIP